MLAFLSSGCLTCRDFWDAFSKKQLDLPGSDTLRTPAEASAAFSVADPLVGLSPQFRSACWYFRICP